ncbi:MAG: thioredoxin domain-containing protein, partial [Phycisphaerae bacterium]
MKTSPKGASNRLAGASSPYLLQHASNPVDWHEWGKEALARARREDKPIFLSIGYSTCHWCHVMAHESFEDAETAALMNAHFVCIKVDREERPDLDELYMAAVHAMGAGGGWPLNVFLTPDLKPFYGGTYWPPQDHAGRPAFRRVLRTVADAYAKRRRQIQGAADQVATALGGLSLAAAPSPGEPTADLFDRALAEWRSDFDEPWGGFGGAPKFPPATALRALLRIHDRTGDADALRMVERTLDAMAAGGIRDHLGGGFHRYAVDREWLVPHFEKMLYDNALLALAYLEAHQATGEARWADVTRETLEYLLRDLADPAGGFHSAQDADSEGVEGKFYVWTPAQLREILGPDDARLAASYYDVSETGNFEGANILHAAKPIEVVARMEGLKPDVFRERLEAARAKLLEARARRVPTGTDDKVLADWNALAISALATAHRVLGEARYGQAAGRAADFLLANRDPREGLLHAWRSGRGHTPAFRDDYAYLADALVDLYEATFEPRWVREATTLGDEMIRRFWDAQAGAFFRTRAEADDVLVRLKGAHDGALPSGNSVAARALARLA